MAKLVLGNHPSIISDTPNTYMNYHAKNFYSLIGLFDITILIKIILEREQMITYIIWNDNEKWDGWPKTIDYGNTCVWACCHSSLEPQ
jgi:hypothetical protein